MPFEAQRTGEMRTIRWLWLAVALGTAASTAHAQEPDRHATGLQADVWTDRGNDAVYQPGDTMIVQTHVSHDANLLVYEIDTEGAVSVLFPERGGSGFVEGGSTIDIPSEHSNLQLVVEPETGESFIVAIASRDPFRDLPWYLRPYDPQAEGNGYAGEPDDEEGITEDGRIVGDPFVAMERIRRRVLQHPDDPQSFGTSYTSYYTHERVLYPRYLCADCHRPDYYSWWDGFDPYYAQCPVVEFRVNWAGTGARATGSAAFPTTITRSAPTARPEWRMYSAHRWYSSWDCWGQWHERMGSGGQAPRPITFPRRAATTPCSGPGRPGPACWPRGPRPGVAMAPGARSATPCAPSTVRMIDARGPGLVARPLAWPPRAAGPGSPTRERFRNSKLVAGYSRRSSRRVPLGWSGIRRRPASRGSAHADRARSSRGILPATSRMGWRRNRAAARCRSTGIPAAASRVPWR